MKTITVSFLLMLAIATIHAQDYQINFEGTGASTTIDSVQVKNLTQGSSLTLPLGTDVLHLTGTIGISKTSKDEKLLTVYPNPMQGQTELSFYAKQAGNIQLIIYDISGRKVLQTGSNISQGIQNYQIIGLSHGTYFVNVSGENYSYTAKLISLNTTPCEARIDNLNTKPEGHNTLRSQTEPYMPYTIGDRLLFKGISGNYATIITDIPTSSKTITFNFVPCTDADNNNYAMVQIGTQKWMAENLRTSKYSNGTSILKILDGNAWDNNLTSGAYCWYNNDSATYENPYGKLYNWYSIVNTNKICPVEWHVPSNDEWTTLTDYLTNNGYGYEGSGEDIAKSLAANSNWYTYNINTWIDLNEPWVIGCNLRSNNSTGFTAFPAGFRNMYGIFSSIRSRGLWWSSDEKSTTDIYSRYLEYDDCFVTVGFENKRSGISARCLKDEMPTLSTTSITSVSINSALSGGNITYNGGAPVIARGVCWSTSPNPTIANNFTANGTDIGSYTSNLTGLLPLTTYYVRAYATNSVGTAYGDEKSFTTTQNIILPILSTTAVSNITTNTATSGGNITSEGGASVTARGVCWSTSQNPVATGSHTTDDTGAGIFTSSMTDLTPNTTYYMRAYATNSAGTVYGNEICFTTINTPSDFSTVSDIDGNIYTTVKIGTQWWMQENLKTTKYNNGTAIPKVTDNTSWNSLTTGAYCWYLNDSLTYENLYGKLYNWYTVNTGNLCPSGWHVPTDADWTSLTNHLGGESIAGTKLKSTTGWYHSGNGTNDYGFTALPSGLRYYTGSFDYEEKRGCWWSSTVQNLTSIWYRYLYYNESTVSRYAYDNKYGLSVRCIKD